MESTKLAFDLANAKRWPLFMVYKAQKLILTERINHQLNFNPPTSPAFAKSMKLKII
jgi:hypothetical protein